MRPPRRVVIDTDPGIDDVVTLALAARSPEIQLIAVTTTYGNAPLALTTRNARLILELSGRPDIPVLPGADRPRTRPLTTAPETHGSTGVGCAPVPATPPGTVCPNPGALASVLEEAGAPVTLVTLGPLTNLAAVIEHEGALATRRIAHHIGMFGSLHERGATDRWADFNTWSDPEAADIVVRSRLPTQMVGLDVTRKMTMSSREVDELGRSSHALARWLAAAMEFRVEGHRSEDGQDGCVVNDVLTIGQLVTPRLLRFETVPLTVDLDEGQHRGHTRGGSGARASPLQIATTVDLRRMRHSGGIT